MISIYNYNRINYSRKLKYRFWFTFLMFGSYWVSVIDCIFNYIKLNTMLHINFKKISIKRGRLGQRNKRISLVWSLTWEEGNVLNP